MTDEPLLLAVLIVCCALLVANLVGLVWFAVAHAKYGRDRFEESSGACEHHNAPLVCGVEDCRDDPIEEPAHWTVEECVEVMASFRRDHFCRDGFHHVRRPGHRIIAADPEHHYYGEMIVPCGLAQ